MIGGECQQFFKYLGTSPSQHIGGRRVPRQLRHQPQILHSYRVGAVFLLCEAPFLLGRCT